MKTRIKNGIILILLLISISTIQSVNADEQRAATIVDLTNGNISIQKQDAEQKGEIPTMPERTIITVLDNFNRPDGPIGSNWIGRSGTFKISGMAAIGNHEALFTYKDVISSLVEADVRSNTLDTGLEYVGVVLEYKDIHNNIFIKVQNQDGDTKFDHGACYVGNEGSGFGLGFFPLSQPFNNAHMRAQIIGDTVYITLSNIDGGSGTQTYICTGAPNTGGHSVGIVGFKGISYIDNFAASPVLTVNLLKNPGFETMNGNIPKYWEKYQTGTKAIFTYPEMGRTGGKSVAIKYTTKEAGKVALWRQSGIVISPNKLYKLSGYVKLSNVVGSGHVPRPGGISIRVTWYDLNGRLIETDLIHKKGTSGWTKIGNTFAAPSNAVKATFGVDIFDSSGKVWFDDLSFSEAF